MKLATGREVAGLGIDPKAENEKLLIDEVFHDDMVFHHTGLSPYDRRRKVTLKDQLQNFYFSLLRHGMEDIAQPKSWI